MKTALDLLDQISVAAPCPSNWVEMHGNDQVRFCDSCNKNVYNLSALTKLEAVNLIREKEGKLCAMYFRRADGTVLTADCPVGVHHKIKRRKKLAVLAASFAGFLFFSGCRPLADNDSEAPADAPTVAPQPILPVQVNVNQPPVAILGGLCPSPALVPAQQCIKGELAAPPGLAAPKVPVQVVVPEVTVPMED